MIREDMIRKANFYKDNNVAVHLTLQSGNFVNGKIVEVNDNDLVVDDFKVGETLIIFWEINEQGIVPFKRDKGVGHGS